LEKGKKIVRIVATLTNRHEKEGIILGKFAPQGG